tara:strand:- start:28 stop:246 length:219 start_codon:yes stop_codon:yes gene_type:complete
MTKKEKETISMLIKAVCNIQSQIDILVDNLIVDVQDEQMKTYENKVVDIDKSTYDRMCKMMKTNEIPFMGIA